MLLQYKEICDTLDFERQDEAQLGLRQILRNRGARKRLTIAGTCAFFSTLAGNIIASYYLGAMLEHAGITDTTTQLQIVSCRYLAVRCPVSWTLTILAQNKNRTSS